MIWDVLLFIMSSGFAALEGEEDDGYGRMPHYGREGGGGGYCISYIGSVGMGGCAVFGKGMNEWYSYVWMGILIRVKSIYNGESLAVSSFNNIIRSSLIAFR